MPFTDFRKANTAIGTKIAATAARCRSRSVARPSMERRKQERAGERDVSLPNYGAKRQQKLGEQVIHTRIRCVRALPHLPFRPVSPLRRSLFRPSSDERETKREEKREMPIMDSIRCFQPIIRSMNSFAACPFHCHARSRSRQQRAKGEEKRAIENARPTEGKVSEISLQRRSNKKFKNKNKSKRYLSPR